MNDCLPNTPCIKEAAIFTRLGDVQARLRELTGILTPVRKVFLCEDVEKREESPVMEIITGIQRQIDILIREVDIN